MRRLFTYGLLLFTVLSFAQAKPKKDKDLIKGNDEFADNNYVQAEADYRVSGSKSPTKSAAAYNLGNAIYRQKQNTEAAYAYGAAIKSARTKQQKHMAYHNLGNVLMKEKNYEAAVEAYKNALRNNPNDEQTRYNFALAKDMLKKNPPPPKKDPPPPPKDDKDKNKDNKQQQPNNGGNKDDKNQPPKDKGDNKDKGDKGDQKDKQDKGDKGDNKDDGNDKGGQPKPEPGASPSKQRMDNLLDAMNNEEKKVQDKVNARKVKVRPTKQDKDW